MKTMRYMLIAMMAIAVSFTTTSCDAEDGEDGIDGVDGQQGPQGIPGEDGNANVIVKTFTPEDGGSLDWETGSYLGKPANVFEIEDLDLTQNVVDSSMILMYFQIFGEDPWYPMTFNFPTDSGGDQVLTFTYEVEKLSIYSLQTSGPLNAGVTKLKWFIIESSSQTDLTGIDFSNYYEVSQHFGL